MAHKTDKAVEVFSALGTGKIKATEIEVAEARAAVAELAKNPTPANRYEIAQLMAFSVNDILEANSAYIETFADVKNVGVGEKAMFKIKLDGVKAFIQAKGSTTQRSKIMTKYATLDTDEVSARPYVNYLELASGKVNFDELIADAAYQMELAKVQKIESVMYAAWSGYSTPRYASGSGVVKATLDAQLDAFARLGNVALIGDIAIVSKLADLTGFTTATNTKMFSNAIMDEYNNNGYVGKYRGADVIKMVNPFVAGSLTSTTLLKKLLYILPTGLADMKPLKVVNEGSVTAQDQTNIDDGSYEICLRQNFGAGVVFGANPFMGVYEDSSIS